MTSRAGLNTFLRILRFPSYPCGPLLRLHCGPQREAVTARHIDHGGHLRFRDLVRIHAAEPLALGMNRHHDAISLGGRLVEDGFEDLHDEVHRRVVVVQKQHLEQLRLLGFLPGMFEDLSPGMTLRLAHAVRLYSTKPGPADVLFWGHRRSHLVTTTKKGS